jgi:cobalt-precorrin 5A hydrolase/precorrin-3B C17-methyltransferase
VGTAVLSGERVTLSADAEWPLPALPANVVRTAEPEAGVPSIVVSDHRRGTVTYRPPSLVVGVGSSRGVSAREVGELIDAALAEAGLAPESVRHVATVDLKADEPGIAAAARQRGWEVVTYPAAVLATVPVPNPSERVRAETGTPSVAEAAALHATASPGEFQGSQQAGSPGNSEAKPQGRPRRRPQPRPRGRARQSGRSRGSLWWRSVSRRTRQSRSRGCGRGGGWPSWGSGRGRGIC